TNGDGRADLLAWKPVSFGDTLALNNKFASCVSTASGAAITFNCLPEIEIFSTRADFGVATSDFNGDGITDLMFYPLNPTTPVTQSYQVCLGRGDGTFTMPAGYNTYGNTCTAWTPAYTGASEDRLHIIGDFNGDGRSDFVIFKKQGNDYLTDQICYSTGTRFDCVSDQSPTKRNLLDFWVQGDFNGNGTTDFLFKNYFQWSNPLGTSATGTQLGPQDVVGAVTNGLGSSIKFDYLPITNPTVYAKASSAAVYPIVDVQTPLYVVSALKNTAGGAFTDYVTTYSYRGLRADTRGGGFSGFASRTAYDPQSQVCSQTDTQTDWANRRIAAPWVSLKRYQATPTLGVCASTGVLLNRVTNTWSSRTQTAGVYENFVTLSQEEKNDLNGTPLPPTTTQTPLASIDAFGNVLSTTTSTPDAVGSSLTFTKTTVSTY
ncbi:MAG: toxin TcdB middle/N-terminal domain-containing protein, partial [Burkholderiales bacterium]